jgi:hypothetical protein
MLNVFAREANENAELQRRYLDFHRAVGYCVAHQCELLV